MNITQALEYIHSVSWMGSQPGLERITALMASLGDPQKKLRFVHIAGTNGKGSTAALTASALYRAGYTTGLYTSPYIQCFNERMQVNGRRILDRELAEITEIVQPHADRMDPRPTEFDLVTAIGLIYFARKKCDYVVLEAGMGGALDSTNVIPAPECAVLTNIGLDHTQFLGSTVEKIAETKAGIFKPGSHAVLYEQSPSVTAVVRQACERVGIPLEIADFSQLRCLSRDLEGQRFTYKGHGPYKIRLAGVHQLKNAAVALEILDVLRSRGAAIPEDAVMRGFAETAWPARFEVLSRDPWFILDGGHNPQCAETVAANLKTYFPGRHMILLMGVLGDKDYPGLTDILAPAASEFVTVTPNCTRALPAEELAEFLHGRYGKPVQSCGSIAEGVETALALAREKDGVVCCVGSLYMAGAVRECFGLS